MRILPGNKAAVCESGPSYVCLREETGIMRNLVAIIMIAVLFAGVASGQSKKVQGSAVQCDRNCLEGFVNQYLSAMVARDASRAPFAEKVKYTEDARQISLAKPAEGLWAVLTSLGDYKLYIADPQAGQVAFVGLVKEGEKTALLSMRLKVEDKKITEVESIVVRNMNENNLWTLKTPPPEFSRTLAPEERVSREELVRISSAYFDGIVKINSKLVPWHDECYRLENGMWTAGEKLPEELAANMPKTGPAPKQPGPGGSIPAGRKRCAADFDTGVFALIESIQPRRTPVVDEERGVTWGVYMFNHPGVATVKMPDGSVKPAAYFVNQPNSMPMSELFKIKGGKIRDIMAIGVVNKYKSGSGWE
jgi:hypothetical protein